MLDAFAFEFGRPDELNAARIEPLDETADGLQRFRLMRFDDNPDTTYGGFGHGSITLRESFTRSRLSLGAPTHSFVGLTASIYFVMS